MGLLLVSAFARFPSSSPVSSSITTTTTTTTTAATTTTSSVTVMACAGGQSPRHQHRYQFRKREYLEPIPDRYSEEGIVRSGLRSALEVEFAKVGPERGGRSTAAAIIAYRTQHGPFRTVDALGDVKGIGTGKLEQLRPLVAV